MALELARFGVPTRLIDREALGLSARAGDWDAADRYLTRLAN